MISFNEKWKLNEKEISWKFQGKSSGSGNQISGHHCRIIIEVRGPQGPDYALEKGGPEGLYPEFFPLARIKKQDSADLVDELYYQIGKLKANKRIVPRKRLQ